MNALTAGVLFGVLLAPGALRAQDSRLESKPKPYIAYAAEPQYVPAGKSAALELHFRVRDGFHVNSHTPKSSYLLPTNLEFTSSTGVKAAPIEYPPGKSYSFSFEPDEKLDVYSGAFNVKLPVVATAGEHRLAGTLKYQACDQVACYPPGTLAVEVLFTAQ